MKTKIFRAITVMGLAFLMIFGGLFNITTPATARAADVTVSDITVTIRLRGFDGTNWYTHTEVTRPLQEGINSVAVYNTTLHFTNQQGAIVFSYDDLLVGLVATPGSFVRDGGTITRNIPPINGWFASYTLAAEIHTGAAQPTPQPTPQPTIQPTPAATTTPAAIPSPQPNTALEDAEHAEPPLFYGLTFITPTQPLPAPITGVVAVVNANGETLLSSEELSALAETAPNHRDTRSETIIPDRPMTNDELKYWMEDYFELGGINAFEFEVIRIINEIRAEHDLNPLAICIYRSMAARFHSQDMRDNRFFAHHSPSQGAGRSRIFWLGGGTENIFSATGTPEIAVQAWMNSPGHRANILNPRNETIGVGAVHGTTAKFGIGPRWGIDEARHVVFLNFDENGNAVFSR